MTTMAYPPDAGTYVDDGTFAASGSGQREDDDLRAVRQFVGIFNGILNQDQTYAGTDGIAANPPGQYIVYSPGVGASQVGQPVSTQQVRQVGLTLPPLGWLLLAGLVYLAVK
jgi:hypothetical protein